MNWYDCQTRHSCYFQNEGKLRLTENVKSRAVFWRHLWTSLLRQVLQKARLPCTCRNTSAKPAVRRSPQRRSSQVRQTRIRTLKTFKLTYELLKFWFYPLKYVTHHVFINYYLGYVVGTYPPSTPTCFSCRREVLVTYRAIEFISCRKHVSDTCNSGELILIGTE